jgi:hypothetical protein
MDGPVHAEVGGRRAPGSRVSVVSERLINSIGNPEEKLRKGLNFVFVTPRRSSSSAAMTVHVRVHLSNISINHYHYVLCN